MKLLQCIFVVSCLLVVGCETQANTVKYEGQYYCNGRHDDVVLKVTEKANNKLTAVFSFRRGYNYRNVPKASGSFSMTGKKYDDAGTRIVLKADRWIEHPKGLHMLDLEGVFNGDKSVIYGKVKSEDCGTYYANHLHVVNKVADAAKLDVPSQPIADVLDNSHVWVIKNRDFLFWTDDNKSMAHLLFANSTREMTKILLETLVGPPEKSDNPFEEKKMKKKYDDKIGKLVNAVKADAGQGIRRGTLQAIAVLRDYDFDNHRLKLDFCARNDKGESGYKCTENLEYTLVSDKQMIVDMISYMGKLHVAHPNIFYETHNKKIPRTRLILTVGIDDAKRIKIPESAAKRLYEAAKQSPFKPGFVESRTRYNGKYFLFARIAYITRKTKYSGHLSGYESEVRLDPKTICFYKGKDFSNPVYCDNYDYEIMWR